ncbi:MAG TPA: helical backbone metal receptor [Bacteroidia bacterium]|jgi:ABC-type Fe3+-hydroxamate transport system substrate-binding protein|nr:helical backbone metal receptor [Bacteroidia bacterium]
MRKFTDQMGRIIEVSWPPKRIISIVPSQTELLYSLGLENEVMGITKFCVHPDSWFRTKQRIGGTKKLDFDKIAALKPDLIIGNKEENNEQEIKALMETYPVWMSDIHNLDDAFAMMQLVGELTNRAKKANEIVNQAKHNFAELDKAKYPVRKAAYFIWKNPYMLAGNDTFINNMLALCGFKNIASEVQGRYPELSVDTLKNLNPDVIFLSSEPFPFSGKHIDEFKTICPGAKIVLVDGEYFSWYGSRLLAAPDYFKSLLNEMQ